MVRSGKRRPLGWCFFVKKILECLKDLGFAQRSRSYGVPGRGLAENQVFGTGCFCSSGWIEASGHHVIGLETNDQIAVAESIHLKTNGREDIWKGSGS
jgi:hypothetical protein